MSKTKIKGMIDFFKSTTSKKFKFNCYADNMFTYQRIVCNRKTNIVKLIQRIEIISDSEFLQKETLEDLVNSKRISYLSLSVVEVRKDKGTEEILERAVYNIINRNSKDK